MATLSPSSTNPLKRTTREDEAEEDGVEKKKAKHAEDVEQGAHLKETKKEQVDEEKEEDEEEENEEMAAQGNAAPSSAALTPGSEKKRKYQKKKVAIVLGYCGFGYSGLQQNRGVLTIEDELERALLKIGGISEANFGSSKKNAWTRSCRTDKGVHALGNVVSLKVILLPDLQNKLNQELPPSIRVFNIIRTFAHFSAFTAIDHRQYEYVLPAYAFIPILNNANFTFDDKMLERVNSILRMYEGSHNFYNFTINKKFTDKSCYRYMKSIKCSPPEEIEGMSLVKIHFVGQSFMLHQIRKMIGTMLFIVRHSISENMIPHIYGKTQFLTPMAPGEFLFLDWCCFKSYNNRLTYKKSEHPPIITENLPGQAEFRVEQIYKPLIEKEKKEHLVRDFIKQLDSLRVPYDGKNVDLYEFIKMMNKLPAPTKPTPEEEAMHKKFIEKEESGEPNNVEE